MCDTDVRVDTFGVLLAGLLEAERDAEPVSERSRHASGVYALGTSTSVAPPSPADELPELS